MAIYKMLSVLYPLLLAALVLNCHCDEIRKLHVVYMGDRPHGDSSLASTHHSILQSMLGSDSSAKDSLVYSYERSFNGFAAKLTEEEAATIAEMEGVVSVIPNRKLKLHTTRSWDFMGFSKGKLGASQEGEVIIGLLDTGVWPEHPSFNDTGYGPPPAKWKGICQTTNFTCNNKLIGARYYNSENDFDHKDIPSPRDTEGHGTHTASTIAGAELPGTSFLGLAEGVARDGVDVISVSLGSSFPSDYFDDPIAIGSFHAMKHGILTSCSAGNSGPEPVTVSNFAPWTMTVAASTIDRKFVANLALGNGQILTGISINTFDLNGTSYPLIWGGDAVNYTYGSTTDYTQYCEEDAMNLDMLAGKIVLCDGLQDGLFITQANGIGIVIFDSTIVNPAYAFSYPVPATLINPEDSKKNPVATILVGETWKDAMAPMVVSFSSRGPNPISPDILKPDISAPGVDILAGWSPLAPPSISYKDTRSLYYNVISGTSMACPHASARLPTLKPVTLIAHVMDPTRHNDLEFSYGSGHINPAAALDPGLVFDASETDYINFLCKQGYNTTTLQLVTGDNSTCANISPGRAWDLNYPSFSLYVEDGQQIMGTFTRTVTNVGPPNSTYTATLYLPLIISVDVEPSVLTFSAVGETKTFTVKVTGPAITQQPIMSGTITWNDGSHSVRTPLVVYNYFPGAPYTDSEVSNSVLENKPKLQGSFKENRSGFIRLSVHLEAETAEVFKSA
ncbi:hypothetical protein DH2020_005407 [Rehmannia glutinosa]|uniref:Cucumisin n=1 Tax=Rehmannia glutinosa TaxID=99300 RepID=A0ABR0XGK4_REHGL